MYSSSWAQSIRPFSLLRIGNEMTVLAGLYRYIVLLETLR
jgi:hypothetical protein